jgi:hypothetical protein
MRATMAKCSTWTRLPGRCSTSVTRSLDCSELQRAHAHQAKGTWDPPVVAQFDWFQEVVDRVLAWVYVTNGDLE